MVLLGPNELRLQLSYDDMLEYFIWNSIVFTCFISYIILPQYMAEVVDI